MKCKGRKIFTKKNIKILVNNYNHNKVIVQLILRLLPLLLQVRKW